MTEKFRPRIWRFVILVALLAAMASFLYVQQTATRHQPVPPGATEVLSPNASTPGGTSSSNGQSSNPQEALAQFIMKRDRTQSKAIADLKQQISGASGSSGQKGAAAAQLAGMTQAVAEEQEIADLLAVKGMHQVAALVTPHKVVIVVGKSGLTEEEVAMVAGVAQSVTGIGYSHITVVPAA